MGFNNGYDSGYCDAKAELEPKITALEKEIAELKSASSTVSGPKKALDLERAGIPVYQVVGSGDAPVLDTTKAPVASVTDGAVELDIGTDGGTLAVVYQNAAASSPSGIAVNGAWGMDDGVGIYLLASNGGTYQLKSSLLDVDDIIVLAD